MNKTPLISIVITIFNYQRYLPRLVDSLTIQESQNYEVIFVNDGSTDDTEGWLETYKSHFVFANKIIHQQNQGKTSAARAGIEASTGAYVLLLDADDTLLPEAINRFSREIEEDKEAEVFFANHSSQKGDNNEHVKCSNNPNLSTNNKLNLKKFLIDKVYSFATGSYVFKKELATRFFYPDNLDIAEDIPFEAHLLANCKCKIIDSVVLKIHKHNDSRRHNVSVYLQQHMDLVNAVFDIRKMPEEYMFLREPFAQKVKISLFNKLVKGKYFNDALNVFKDIRFKNVFFNIKLILRYIQCLQKK